MTGGKNKVGTKKDTTRDVEEDSEKVFKDSLHFAADDNYDETDCYQQLWKKVEKFSEEALLAKKEINERMLDLEKQIQELRQLVENMQRQPPPRAAPDASNAEVAYHSYKFPAIQLDRISPPTFFAFMEQIQSLRSAYPDDIVSRLKLADLVAPRIRPALTFQMGFHSYEQCHKLSDEEFTHAVVKIMFPTLADITANIRMFEAKDYGVHKIHEKLITQVNYFVQRAELGQKYFNVEEKVLVKAFRKGIKNETLQRHIKNGDHTTWRSAVQAALAKAKAMQDNAPPQQPRSAESRPNQQGRSTGQKRRYHQQESQRKPGKAQRTFHSWEDREGVEAS